MVQFLSKNGKIIWLKGTYSQHLLHLKSVTMVFISSSLIIMGEFSQKVSQTSDLQNSAPNAPTELSLRGHLFKVETAAQVNHSHHLGKAAEGSRGKVPSSRTEWALAGERLQLFFPGPQVPANCQSYT